MTEIDKVRGSSFEEMQSTINSNSPMPGDSNNPSGGNRMITSLTESGNGTSVSSSPFNPNQNVNNLADGGVDPYTAAAIASYEQFQPKMMRNGINGGIGQMGGQINPMAQNMQFTGGGVGGGEAFQLAGNGQNLQFNNRTPFDVTAQTNPHKLKMNNNNNVIRDDFTHFQQQQNNNNIHQRHNSLGAADVRFKNQIPMNNHPLNQQPGHHPPPQFKAHTPNMSRAVQRNGSMLQAFQPQNESSMFL